MASEIRLSQGKFAIVDDADAELAELFRWHASRNVRTFYAVHSVSPTQKLMLHRAVWARMHPGVPLPPEVDHINGDGLDCRRGNLRGAEHRQNNKNLRRKRNNSSGYVGVTQDKRSGKWKAQIFADGRHYYLGQFDSPVDAARARDAAARDLFGRFATLNFPADGERYVGP